MSEIGPPKGRRADVAAETGTEATAFDPGPTRLFSFEYEWIIDADTFATYFVTNKTHSQFKKLIVLKRIAWLLICHRKMYNSYRQSFLFSLEPRDAAPSELKVHRAAIRIRASQCSPDGPLPFADVSNSPSIFAELDLSNFSVSAFKCKFTVEGEVTIAGGDEGKLGDFRQDMTRLMDGNAESGPMCTIAMQDGSSVIVHRAVLCRQSSVFAAMLRSDGLREGREALVEIADLSVGVVRALLHWLYTARIPSVVQDEEDAATLAELFLAADKYNVGPLRAKTETLLRQNLNNDSVCTVFALAHTFDALSMKEQALNYILDNFNEVRKLTYFEQMVTQHPQLSLEILRNVAHK